MMSVAVSGSVSDATKTAPTITVSHLQINMTDEGGGTVHATEDVANGGASATTYDLSSMQAMGAEFFVFKLKIAVGGGGGSSRTTNHMMSIGTIGRDDMHSTVANPQPCFIHTGYISIAGNPNSMLGMFMPPEGPDGSGSQAEPYAIIASKHDIVGGSSANYAPTITTPDDASIFLVDPPAINPHTPLRCPFMVPANSLEVFDQQTGLYATGPSGNLTYDVQIQL